MVRKRALMVSCLIGASVLLLFGLHRWPLEFKSRRMADAGGGTESRQMEFSFAKDSSRGDRILGAADYVTCTLLLPLGLVFRFRRPFPVAAEERLPQWEVLDLVCALPCVLGFLVMTPVSILVVLSLVR